ncbi:MAG: ATP-binding protein [Acidobacteriia bacterium]|nr:ATP-binding protein [Terriglobia bacterium]
MFNIPIEHITIQDIAQFLQSGAREGTLLDFKEQFPSKLEKTISSMANTFGGMILIGVEETPTGGGILPVKGLPMGPGLRERVIQIGINSIYPPLISEVSVVEFKSDPTLAAPDKAVVAIRVHESEYGHAVDQRTTVYVRADNVSDWMKKATVEEVEWFLQKRQKSMIEKQRIIDQAFRHSQYFLAKVIGRNHRPEPEGRFVIWTVPTFPRGPIATPRQLFQLTAKQFRPMPAIGQFPSGSPRPVRDGVSWARDESADYYYTEFHQQGLIYSEIEFWWDKQIHDKVFLPEAAAKLLLAAVEYARDLYRKCGYFGLFDVGMRICGVSDRVLRNAIINTVRVIDNEVEVNTRASAAEDERELLPKCKGMIQEIYWAFGRDAKDDRLEADFR